MATAKIAAAQHDKNDRRYIWDSTSPQDRFGVVAVEPLLLRRKDCGFRNAIFAHPRIARRDLGGIVGLVELLLAAGEPLHPGGARLAKLYIAFERCDWLLHLGGQTAGQHLRVPDAL